jgi:hypothetical protein
MKMKAHPRVMRRICHHWSLFESLFVGVGALIPVIVGKGGTLAVPEGSGTTTSSDRHTPIPVTTDVLLLQLASTHEPPLNTLLFESPQARQELGPAPEQLEQLESQAWQVEVVLSKN